MHLCIYIYVYTKVVRTVHICQYLCMPHQKMLIISIPPSKSLVFQSIVSGVHEILVGDASIVLTGGTDNMSSCPYAVRDIRFGTKLGMDPKLEDMMWAALTDSLTKTPMGVTAENLAAKYGGREGRGDPQNWTSEFKKVF